MSAEIIQFIPRTSPKQSTDLVELGHRLITTALWDSDATWAGTQTCPTYRMDDVDVSYTAADYVAPPDDCA